LAPALARDPFGKETLRELMFVATRVSASLHHLEKRRRRALSRGFNFVIIKNLIPLLGKSWKKSKEKTRHWWCATLNMVKSGCFSLRGAARVCACFDAERVQLQLRKMKEEHAQGFDFKGARRSHWQLNLPGGSFAFLTPLLFKMQISCLKSGATSRG
jgi:hypothetical protein